MTTQDLGAPPDEFFVGGAALNAAQCLPPSTTVSPTQPTAITDPSPPPTSSPSPATCSPITLGDETLAGYTLFIPPPSKVPFYPSSEFFDKAFLSTALFFPESDPASPSVERMAYLCAEKCEEIFDPELGEVGRCQFSYAFSGTYTFT